jgi:hypothetical protein
MRARRHASASQPAAGWPSLPLRKAMTSLPHSAAADRNKEPILAVLRQLQGLAGRPWRSHPAPASTRLVRGALPGWTWQPTDADASMLPAIAAHRRGRPVERAAAAATGRGGAAVARAAGAFAERFDAICANMLHIAPWSACAGLMAGAARQLASGGRLVTWPLLRADQPAAPGNLAFDESLRARVRRGASGSSMTSQRRQNATAWRCSSAAMPANNLLLVFAAAAELERTSSLSLWEGRVRASGAGNPAALALSAAALTPLSKGSGRSAL